MFTPTEIYWMSLTLIIIGALGIGFVVGFKAGKYLREAEEWLTKYADLDEKQALGHEDNI